MQVVQFARNANSSYLIRSSRLRRSQLAYLLIYTLYPLLRKIVLRDQRDFLEASREFVVFILGSYVSVSKVVYFVIFL